MEVALWVELFEIVIYGYFLIDYMYSIIYNEENFISYNLSVDVDAYMIWSVYILT